MLPILEVANMIQANPPCNKTKNDYFVQPHAQSTVQHKNRQLFFKFVVEIEGSPCVFSLWLQSNQEVN